jgi:hypothetical protein
VSAVDRRLSILIVTTLIPILPVEEEYVEIEGYDRPADYSILSSELNASSDSARGAFTIFDVMIENSVFDGVFQVELRLFDLKGLYGAENTNVHILAGTTRTLRAEFDTHYGQEVRGEVSVTPPTTSDQRLVTRYWRAYRSVIGILLPG